MLRFEFKRLFWAWHLALILNYPHICEIISFEQRSSHQHWSTIRLVLVYLGYLWAYLFFWFKHRLVNNNLFCCLEGRWFNIPLLFTLT